MTEPVLGAVVVLAKRPEPGRVKTRLVPPLTYESAAAVAAAALRDTLREVAAVSTSTRVLSFAGDPSGWLPPGWLLHEQPAGGHDVRIAAALASCRGPVVLVGMDTPQLHATQVAAFDPIAFDACLGLADDGGYWTIGLRDPSLATKAVHGVPMSTSSTGAQQLERLRSLGLRVQLLDQLADVDTIEVGLEVAATAPLTEFARALRAAVPVPHPPSR